MTFILVFAAFVLGAFLGALVMAVMSMGSQCSRAEEEECELNGWAQR